MNTKHFFMAAIGAVIIMTGCTTCTKEKNTLYEGIEFADARMERGVKQAAALWTEEDGSAEDFKAFVEANYARTEEERTALFESLSRMMEKLNESADMLTVELLKPTQLTNAGEPTEIDWIMSGYDTRAHLMDDLFANKVAFITILNFPFYSLEEKNTLGREWSRREWAEARLGDVFTSRVPAKIQARLTETMAAAENYIADYNICMDRLRTEDGRQLFPDGMKLLSHWNLRDELKVDYNDQEKQEMIYQVMQRIVRQEIPQEVINNPDPIWYPYSNKVESKNSKVESREPDTRYQKILDIFHAMQQVDAYCPNMPTGIIRNFEGDIEIPAAEIDSLFRSLISSEQVKIVAVEIKNRLGRELRPYDIWYDGFKARSGMDEEALSAETRKRFPDPITYEKKIAGMLTTLGFQKENAEEISRHIVVEPARGSGHAWPCMGHNEPSRLRTRIAPEGMDYKGYNIAVHEMGHNVEEVISLYKMDYYMLHGIPNTGFTETSAFLFQARDLQLLGYGKQTMNRETVLDQFWGMYEIMGVSLVDMRMWQWLYDHPKTTASELREAVLEIAAEVWNAYYEPVLGEKDCVLLAIYSHMVNSPMYLPNYPIGHIVQFQLEQALADKEGQAWAEAYERWYRLGRLTPQEWMRQAVNGALSVQPILQQIQ